MFLPDRGHLGKRKKTVHAVSKTCPFQSTILFLLISILALKDIFSLQPLLKRKKRMQTLCFS
jgi:hypothetical protein